MFPLSILPLPGELVPLHIFEPRYRQLLRDAESKDVSFGIYFNNSINQDKVGSLVKLESVIKRYPTGESDIIVKCVDMFTLKDLHRTFSDKLYPGGDVSFWQIDLQQPVSDTMETEYVALMKMMRIAEPERPITVYSIANQLSLALDERLRFALMSPEKKESFVFSHIRYQTTLLRQAQKARDVFHLN